MSKKNSTFKKYTTGLRDLQASDFSDHTFSDGGFTVHYKKAGKFYFAFSLQNGGGGNFIIGGDTFGGSVTDIHNTFDRFAFKIGVTISAYFPDTTTDGAFCLANATGSTGTFYAWNGAAYVNGGGNVNYVGLGFLAN
jgi:hypothetical protein